MAFRAKSILVRLLLVAFAMVIGFGLNMYWSRVPLDGILGKIAAVFQTSSERSAPAPGKEEPPASPASDPARSAPLAVEQAPAGGQEAGDVEQASQVSPSAPTPGETAAKEPTARASAPESSPASGQAPPEPVVADTLPGPTPEPGMSASESMQAASTRTEQPPATSGKTSDRSQAKVEPVPATEKPQPVTAAKERSASRAAASMTGSKAGSEEAVQLGEFGANRLLDITSQEGPDGLLVTVESQSAPGKVVVHLYKNPARIAVDLPGSWSGNMRPVWPVSSDAVEKIRLGQHPEKLRLVLDCRVKESSPPEPVIERQAKGLVIRVPKAKATP